MDKIKTVKIKNPDGSVSEETYTISVDAKNVDMKNGKDLQDTIGDINVDRNGSIAEQLGKYKDYDSDIETLYADVDSLEAKDTDLENDIIDLQVNKINKTDIIDNLNSSSNTKVLSAKQGKVLGDAVTALEAENVKKKPYYFNTVADMKADIKLKVGDMAITLGYYEANDGGNGNYKIREKTDTDNVDEMLLISLNNENLVAELIKENNINIKQLGAYGDGIHNDTSFLQKAVDNFNNIFIQKGTYIINKCKLNSNIKIYGEKGTILKYNRNYTQYAHNNIFMNYEIDNVKSINYRTLTNIEINNIQFENDNHNSENLEYGRTLFLWGCNNVKIHNCKFINWNGDAISINNDNDENDSTYNFEIYENEFINDGNGRQAITIAIAHDINIHNNKFYNTTHYTMPGAIDIEPDITTDVVIKNIEIHDNICVETTRLFNIALNQPAYKISLCNNKVINTTPKDQTYGIHSLCSVNGVNDVYIGVTIKDNIVYSNWKAINVSQNDGTKIINNYFHNCVIVCENNKKPRKLIISSNNFESDDIYRSSIYYVYLNCDENSYITITNNNCNSNDNVLSGCFALIGATQNKINVSGNKCLNTTNKSMKIFYGGSNSTNIGVNNVIINPNIVNATDYVSPPIRASRFGNMVFLHIESSSVTQGQKITIPALYTPWKPIYLQSPTGEGYAIIDGTTITFYGNVSSFYTQTYYLAKDAL